MTGVSIISKEYVDKNKLIDTANKIANELKFEVQKEDLHSSFDDLNFYIEDNISYLITFWAIKESEFKEDKLIVNDEGYYVSIVLNHDLEAIPHLNVFLREFLTAYPEMLVGDELHTDFYSIKQIEEKDNLPKWLLI